ncbi:hypothetical protein WJX72_007474 [[Myrmecia] bisecta]|uniref:SAM-dependent MTase RsmB/NOP-type domain-containing protein n=1 Tax=[Myrmecia] bisecta TaxID=41462 RepID=A0AAW1Q9M9_9CHLO
MATKTYAPTVQWQADVEQYFTAAFGAEMLQQISEALCRPPLITSLRVNTLRSTPEAVVAALATELAAEKEGQEAPPACADHRQSLASAHTPFVHQRVPGVVCMAGSGPHEVDYTPTQGKEVVIARGAGEAVLRGAHIFVPGVLACSPGIQKGDLVAVSVALEQPGGVGRVEMERAQMFRLQHGVAVTMRDPVFRLPSCNGLLPGLVMPQNLPSILAAHVLAPKPGATVLDMCAAPGGKTTALAELMQDRGTLYALDRSHAKVQDIRDLAAELGMTCIRAHKLDATRAVVDHVPAGNGHMQAGSGHMQAGTKGATPNGHSSKVAQRQERKRKAMQARGLTIAPPPSSVTEAQIAGFHEATFDYILLDGPCSALGLRPRLIHGQTLKELRGTALYQRNFLDTAIRLLKPGGELVYSTCTINPGENERNVRHVLDKYPCMSLVPQALTLSGPGLTGGITHADGEQEQWLTPDEARLVQRFDPADAELDTIGFFVAKFVKAK